MENRLWWKTPFRGNVLRINRPETVHEASWTAHFALGFVGGCVRVLGNAGPFGVAMTARAGGPGGLFCAMGAAAGYLVSGGPIWSLRYLAALILVFTASFLLRDSPILERSAVMPAVSGAVMAVTGALSAFDTLGNLSTLVSVVMEALLTGLGPYFFRAALTTDPVREERDELRRNAGVILLLCCTLMALSRWEVPGILCPGRAAACFCVMTAAFGGGAAAGSFAGVVLGLAMDLAAGGSPGFLLCYGFSGLLDGALKRQGRLLFLMVYLTAKILSLFWQPEERILLPAMYEAFVASVVFLAMPSRVLSALIYLTRRPELGAGEAGMRRYTAGRTRDLAAAFQELYETVRRSAESSTDDTDVATVYDRAAEAVCSDCPRKNDCWNKEYVDTLSMLENATAAMARRGRLELEDLPEPFRTRCRSAESFAAAVNMELRALIYRRQRRSRLEENRSAAYGQYRYLAGVLKAMAKIFERPPGRTPLPNGGCCGISTARRWTARWRCSGIPAAVCGR